ncbi:FG-GAP-like repeat-containing protein [Micromonospora narathiwatensis]|uniref:Repeat domain-containing protein n=1 Tax=Micromonospora narathiwatensis TaxID=299146 RepID=A0A1A8ZK61_9ACTN|nr:FG-GAP-like repeat-containing protein [Micromonospora narathiwatensis]SBT44223.1 Repeat domain-containing protein [Micromonospora narathiwatensis]
MGGLRFLPWVRDGVARVVPDVDPLTGALPHARATVELSVTALGTETATGETREITGTSTAVLHGPGDVVGIDPQEIIRSFPAPGAENVEVSLFAAVEFDRPDLPWLYTPARPDARGALRPWLVLVVVPVDGGGELRTEAGQPLPRLATTVRQLPTLADSWAWAHAQVLVTVEDEDVAAVIATAPERTLSRLLCPRRLAAGTDYLAAVVPAFAAGVRAGLGEPVDDTGPLAPAWGPGSAHPGPDGPVLLPVYHHWTFRTGPDGDFESLARRLRARPLPADVGRQPVDIAAPGGGLPQQPDEGVEGRSVLGFEGALAAPGMTPTGWAEDVRAAWQSTLTGLLRHSADRLTPPLYGDIHSQEDGLPAPGVEPRWLAGLNLDPRYRAAAALGTQVVQRHQEDLAAAAWQRAAEIRAANEQLRRGQAARDTATALYARRVDPDAPGAAVDDDRLVALTQPVHDLVDVPARGLAAGSAGPLDRRLDANPGAKAATSAPVRRLLRPRGPLARRVDDDAATTALTRLAGGGSAVPPARVPAGGTVLDTLLSDGRGVGDLTRAVIEQAAKNGWWHTGTSGLRSARAALAADDPVTRVVTNGGDLLTGDRFFVGTADGRLFERRRFGPDLWVWHDHGTPPGTTVATSGAVAPPGRVYVRTRDSRLFERSWDGDRWVWTDCGAPPTGVHSRPVVGGSVLYVLGGDAALWRFDPANRSWTSLGTPVGGSERLWGSPRPSFVGVLVATSANRLFAHNGQQWRQFNGPAVWGSPAAEHSYPGSSPRLGISYVTPNGQLVSLYGDGSTQQHDPVPEGRRVISLAQDAPPLGHEEGPAIVVLAASTANPADVRLMRRFVWYHDLHERYYWGWDAVTTATPAGGLGTHRPGPFAGDSREGELFAVTADGRLTSYRWGYPFGTSWVDHGTPADTRGAGPVDAPAPADVRFTPKVGLLASLLFTHTVVQGAGSRPRTQIAHNIGDDGVVQEPALTSAVDGPPIPAIARATATTLGTVAPAGRPTLVTAALLPGTAAGTCRIAYWLGRNADANGTATGGWTGPYELPDPVGADVAGIDVALADLDGDGRPELIVAYAADRPGRADNRVFYRIGWRLDDDGRATNGWTDSLPTPMQLDRFTGVGIDVVDMTGDHVPDLLVFATGTVGATPVARYLTGRGVNRRGRVVGGWTAPRAVPDETATARADGAGIAVADISGTRRPDLVVARRTGATVGYRVAFDLDPDGVPVDWSPPVTVTGAADPGARGCTVAVADLRADLVADRAKMGDDFMAAAARHQGRLAPAQALARDHRPAPVDVATAAAAVRETVRPETAVAGEVLAGLALGDGDLVDALPDSGDPLRRLLAGVTFDVPAYELLRGLSQEHVVPNLPAVAPETMTALAANPRFIEAFLVGLNHEMSREMLWREFPADPKQTWFRQFWEVRGAMSAGAPLTDIPPLTDPAWRNGPLGGHLTAVGAPGEQSLVLVIRGELLRRYPSTVVTMRAATWTGPQERTPTGPDVLPIFNAWLSPDLLLFGFPYTAEVARGAGRQADGPAGHFFVLREQPAAPRFGVDRTGDPPPPDAVVFAARPGRNAADAALALLQRPVLLARHASDLLPTPESQP